MGLEAFSACLSNGLVPGPTLKKALCHTHLVGGKYIKYHCTLDIDKMGKSKIIDQDLHKCIVELPTNGLGYRKISSQLNVPLSSFSMIICHWKVCHSICPPKSSGCPTEVTECTVR